MKRSLVMAVVLGSAVSWGARPWQGGAVAAAHPMASEAGLQMLDQGGNAVDAAVAAAFVMAVVGPYHSGLGGGGFAVVHSLSKGDTTLDFREVAPAKATRDMFVQDGGVVPGRSLDGALAVGVPGAIAGYLELLEKYGTLPRAKVLAPAIAAATKGFVVTPKYVQLAKQREACLRTNDDAARVFLRPGPDGVPTAPSLGTVLVQKDLAQTLSTLAKSGAKAVYTGPLGRAVADTVGRAGGVLTAEDLATYATVTREPLTGQYRGYPFITMGPPSAGGLAMVETLGIVERHGPLGPASRDVETLHVFIEALRRAYVDRAKYLGDPAFTQVPLETLRSPEHADQLLRSIDLKHATSSQALLPTPGASENKHTTHISVIDRLGNAVALTTTVNFYFGSCLVAKGTGILLNDQMDDFAAQPGVPNVFGLVTGEANAVAPLKRPLSSMTPTLVFSKDDPTRVMLAVGAPGGSTIPTTVMQVLSNIIDGRLNVVQAVARGRIHHQYLPDALMVDSTALDPATQSALEALGHTLKRVDPWGDVEAVMRDPETGWVTAASDPRNEGAPAGQR